MKKFLLAFSLATFSFVAVNAQDDETGLHFTGGVRLALPIGDFEETHSFGIGVDVTGEYRVSELFGVTLSTGYTHFLGKEVDIPGFGSIEFDGVGMIPVMAGFRLYPTTNFFVGGRAGVAFLTGGDDTETGFNYQPEIGYNLGKIQLAAGYNGFSKDSQTLGHIALIISYRFN